MGFSIVAGKFQLLSICNLFKALSLIRFFTAYILAPHRRVKRVSERVSAEAPIAAVLVGPVALQIAMALVVIVRSVRVEAFCYPLSVTLNDWRGLDL